MIGARNTVPPKPDISSALKTGKLSEREVRDVMRWIEAVGNWMRDAETFAVYEVDFKGGTAPSKAIDSAKPPRGVYPLAFDNITTKAAAQMTAPLSWSYSSTPTRGGRVTFNTLGTGPSLYRLRFAVVEA